MAWTDDDRQAVAAALAREAAGSGGFLLASLVADQLRRHPVDPDRAGWQADLVPTVGRALEAAIEAEEPLIRDDEKVPDGALTLMTALSLAYGKGLPAREVWPAVATALADDGREFGDDDVEWALDRFGRYVIESGEDDQAVYRLFHPLLTASLAQTTGASGRERVAHELHALFELQAEERRDADRSNPYLSRHLPDHLAAAGESCWQTLTDIAIADPARFGRAALAALDRTAADEGQDPARALVAADMALGLTRRLRDDLYLPAAAVADRLVSFAVHAQAAQRYAHAAASGREALGIYTGLVDGRRELRGLVNAATVTSVALQALDEPDSALTVIRRAVDVVETVSGDDASALELRGMVWTALENRLAALELFEEALEANSRGIELADRLVSLDPDSGTFMRGTALFNRGARFAAMGRYGEALELVDAAIPPLRRAGRGRAEHRMLRRALEQRAALALELDRPDIVQSAEAIADAWIDDWLATPTMERRRRLLDGLHPDTAELLAQVIVPRRLEAAGTGTESHQQLEALLGALSLRRASSDEAIEVMADPQRILERQRGALAREDHDQALAYAQLQLATGIGRDDAWGLIASSKHVLGDEAGAREAERQAQLGPGGDRT